MSIPRIAIPAPVTMFMISAIIILLGGISLTRLPVDLLPDIDAADGQRQRALPGRRAARDGGARHAADRAGGQRGRRTRADELHVATRASADVSLIFTWGTDLNEAMDDMRTRLDRVRGRLPTTPIRRRSSSS